MRDKLKAAIREVPISQTYEEYVEALVDRLSGEVFKVAREIIADLEKIIEVNKDGEAKFDIMELHKLEKKYTEEGK